MDEHEVEVTERRSAERQREKIFGVLKEVSNDKTEAECNRLAYGIIALVVAAIPLWVDDEVTR